ncbi:MAG: ATP synthase F1 subunit gamma [Chloroflexi bacterium B3_Chlor]|nr:MAG: ATP synthase F1 subunit gamma [Chloroflexi bacterium B3_Chlor]
MATAREIQRRIRSVTNIGQVTRAMEAVSASKMRRAQERTLASRAYAERAWEILTYLASQPAAGEVLHPLLEERTVRNTALLVITPDRGLCGGLPTNVIREVVAFISRQTTPVRIVSIGRKGSDFMLRYGADICADFSGLPDQPPLKEVTPIARLVIDQFLDGTFDQICLIYANFVNTMVQRPVTRQLMPIEPAILEGAGAVAYTIEPDPETVLGEVLEGFTVLQIYQAILDAQASEHSARMVAMRAATENAEALVEDLTLTYNRARQEAITKELLDIAGGAEALSKARAMTG